jgi:hypothetical protein
MAAYVLRYPITKVAVFEDGLKTAIEEGHLHGRLKKNFRQLRHVLNGWSFL